MRIDRWKIFLDSVGGGAWPFLVGAVKCLFNYVNERDLDLLNSWAQAISCLGSTSAQVDDQLLRGTIGV